MTASSEGATLTGGVAGTVVVDHRERANAVNKPTHLQLLIHIKTANTDMVSP